ncbi:hypothetical protein QBC38DRAFT_452701 [Podospora fimiseda]|uniref:Uncharacterized protein n=1 Tax=Podospora fimiseda TaxID=252190 RepID=A0AAN7BVA2_9PEZI|nr:hypothetical protein QBC38DRAFT_452701 [Podospora fimiseda]
MELDYNDHSPASSGEGLVTERSKARLKGLKDGLASKLRSLGFPVREPTMDTRANKQVEDDTNEAIRRSMLTEEELRKEDQAKTGKQADERLGYSTKPTVKEANEAKNEQASYNIADEMQSGMGTEKKHLKSPVEILTWSPSLPPLRPTIARQPRSPPNSDSGSGFTSQHPKSSAKFLAFSQTPLPPPTIARQPGSPPNSGSSSGFTSQHPESSAEFLASSRSSLLLNPKLARRPPSPTNSEDRVGTTGNFGGDGNGGSSSGPGLPPIAKEQEDEDEEEEEGGPSMPSDPKSRKSF